MYACFTEVCFICRTDLCMLVLQRCALFAEHDFNLGEVSQQVSDTLQQVVCASVDHTSRDGYIAEDVCVTSVLLAVKSSSILCEHYNLILTKVSKQRRYKSLESCTVSTQKPHKYSRSVSKK